MTGGWSLRGRLLRRVLIGVSLGWLVGLGFAILVINHEMGELLDDTLKSSARYSMALYKASQAVGVPDRGVEVDVQDIRIIHQGRVVLTAPWPVLGRDGGQDVAGWRVYRVSDPASGTAIEVGQSNGWRREELLESVGSLLVMMVPVLLVTLLIVWRAVGTALRPATGFAEGLQSRRATDLSPVPDATLPRELAPIPRALNSYLQRLRDQIEAERLFTTNAAHELRTPIAAASAQAQLMEKGIAGPDAPQRMIGALHRLAMLVERLLHLSRAEAGAAGEASCDLAQVTRMVIADTCPEAVFDDGDLERVEVAVHPDAVALILVNLLRNAREHGMGDIRVRLMPGPRLTISNRAAPDASFRHGTFEKSAASRGTGLGLSIIAKAAEREGIGLGFAMRDGRAEVELSF